MDKEDYGIDDLVSPSDKPLLNLIFNAIIFAQDLIEVFKDRNPDRVTIALRFAVIAASIETLFGIAVNTDKVIAFIASLNEDEIAGDDDDV